ncbi:cytochrome c [Vibrio makurazakiensis]|uniref:c-type cytochrome n=1 Tax=Vibrio makurazakiensis TaxID=2910250 RepID=UPI003D0B4C5A
MKKSLFTTALLLSVTMGSSIAYAKSEQSSYMEGGANHIENRQTAFSNIEDGLKKANRLIDGKNTHWGELDQVSSELVGHGEVLKASFPAGSQQGSKASKDIWSKPAKFNSLMEQMDAGFVELYAASVNQDAASAKSALKKSEKTCKSCHRSYRSRW